jgi:glycosyltransferase involved in cell wall biosynthesis
MATSSPAPPPPAGPPGAGTLNLTCIPFHDWRKCQREGFRTRDAHLIRAFARDPRVRRVLVVDRPLSVPEMARHRSAQWRVRGPQSVRLGPGVALTRLERKIFVLDILMPDVRAVLTERHAWFWNVMGRGRVAQAVSAAQQRLRFAHTALVLSSPMYAPVAPLIRPDVLVLDAVDNLLQHPELAYVYPQIAQGYEMLRRDADLIFTTGEPLREFLGEGRDRVWFVPNGVDLRQFQPNAPHPVPADLRALPRPIVGYSGKMQERIDIELMQAVAAALPEVSFVFIGQILNRAWMEPLYSVPNIHFLGDKHYAQLPDYLAAFDVCIIPHHVGKYEHGGTALKLYEYMALHKPVVTTGIGGVDMFADRICIANSAAEFAVGIQRYLAAQTAHQPIPGISDPLPPGNTWDEKAAFILDRIAERWPAV